jgi:hypothetical protein
VLRALTTIGGGPRLLFTSWLMLGACSVPALGASPTDPPVTVETSGRARSNIRSTDPLISGAVDEARTHSSTFRRLVEAIEATDGIVYIASGRCPVIGMRGCLLHVLTTRGDARYLWIVVNTSERPEERIPLIAHELQHALEVLQNRAIRTGQDILNFYRSPEKSVSMGIGRFGGRSYETHAAISMAEAVRADVASAAAKAVIADDER